MKTYEQAVYRQAEIYAHDAHDSMFASVDMSACRVIGFVYEVDPNEVAEEVMATFVENKAEFWR